MTTPQQQTYQAQQEQLRAQLMAALVAVYSNAVAAGGAIPDPAALAGIIARLVPTILASQQTMVALVTNELHRQTGQRRIVVSPREVTGAALRGVPIEQVYRRPFTEIGRQLAAGKPPAQALAAGQRRLEKTAVTDLQLVQTHTVRDFATQLQARRPDTVVGFRRVLSAKPNHCALCILASTQRYRSFDLMPIHPGCGCTVAMIMGDQDPGQVIDPGIAEQIHDIIRRDLGDSYVDAGGRKGLANYRNILVTNDHGELGPVLGVRAHRFTGPDLVPRLGHTRVNPENDAPLND